MKNLGWTLLIASISLSGCATGPFSAKRDLESSAPRQGTVVSCHGYKSWPDCYRTANQTCPSGFDVLEKEEILPTQNRTLRIQCK